MLGFLTALGEALRLANTLTDPTKRKLAYELSLDKKAKKALEAAEKVFLAYESFDSGKITKRQWGIIYRKYKKVFFAND